MIRLSAAMRAALAALALIVGGTVAYGAPTRHAQPYTGARAWTSTVTVAPDGAHVIGNPAARTRLVEYISYTCPHCAHFNQVTQVPLRAGYVRSGRLTLEIRHLVRDPVDLTVALLTDCGGSGRFLGNHDMFLATQDRWIATLTGSSDDQRKRWDTGPLPTRLKALANDFGFYPMMAGRGYTRAQVDACLADKAVLDRVVAQTDGAAKAGVDSTPSFAVNGTLTTAHDWASLEPLIKAAS